jgi:RHS repeat-associated protein
VTIAGSRRDYLPFGEEWPARTPTQDEQSFAGKARDKETALDYFGARYYASGNGRFMTVDPVLDIQNWSIPSNGIGTRTSATTRSGMSIRTDARSTSFWMPPSLRMTSA